MSPKRRVFFVGLAPLLSGATQTRSELRKSLQLPEHQEKLRESIKRVKNSMLVCMLAIVLTMLLTTGVAAAAGLTGGMWSVVPSPNVGSSHNTLGGIAAISASNLWAVGWYADSSGAELTLIEHWNGTSWQVVSSPNVGSAANQLNGVAAISASNLWAVGTYTNSTSSGPYQTLIEHWSGTS